jgi:tRNA(Ile2) C34 agmatinyltransferase TiaS
MKNRNVESPSLQGKYKDEGPECQNCGYQMEITGLGEDFRYYQCPRCYWSEPIPNRLSAILLRQWRREAKRQLEMMRQYPDFICFHRKGLLSAKARGLL